MATTANEKLSEKHQEINNRNAIVEPFESLNSLQILKNEHVKHQDLEDLDKHTFNCCQSFCTKRESSTSWFLLARVFLYNHFTGWTMWAFGLLYTEFTIHFQESKATVGWIVSIQQASLCLLGIFVSWPVERWGCAKPAFVGSLVVSAGYILSAFATSVYVLYATLGFITGLGTAISTMSSAVITQQHFSYNQALAGGIGMLGYSSGNFVVQYVIKYLLRLYGWRGTLLMLGALIANRAPLGLTFWPPKERKVQPSSSQTPSSDKDENAFYSFLKKSLDFTLWKRLPFALFCLASVCHKYYTLAFIHHLPGYILYEGHPLEQATFFTALTALFNTIFRVLITFVANIQCVVRPALYAIGVLIGTFAVTLLLTASGYVGLYAAVLVHGLHLGSTFTIVTVTMVDLVGLDNLPKALALYSFSIGCSSLIATPSTGWLYDITQDYMVPYVMMGCTAFVGSLIAMFSAILYNCSKQNSNEDIG